MKQVSIKTETVAKLSLAPDEKKFYGIGSSPAGYKGFISRENWCDGQFRARCVVDLTEGNGWGYTNDTLAGTIEEMLSNTSLCIYEFDTYQQLLRWLLKP